MHVVGLLAATLAFVAGKAFAAIRSDVRHRDCDTLSATEWKFTANCEDAFGGKKVIATVTLLSIVVAGWALWRLRHV
jgi:hypothetical protein